MRRPTSQLVAVQDAVQVIPERLRALPKLFGPGGMVVAEFPFQFLEHRFGEALLE
jgi:hypothetical protein